MKHFFFSFYFEALRNLWTSDGDNVLPVLLHVCIMYACIFIMKETVGDHT
jgi:hypothetical protein